MNDTGYTTIQVAADVAPEVAQLMEVTRRPIAAGASEGTATRAAWRTIRSWTLVTTQDLAVPADSMRFMAKRAKSTTVEVDASHAVTVSQPGAVAELDRRSGSRHRQRRTHRRRGACGDRLTTTSRQLDSPVGRMAGVSAPLTSEPIKASARCHRSPRTQVPTSSTPTGAPSPQPIATRLRPPALTSSRRSGMLPLSDDLDSQHCRGRLGVGRDRQVIGDGSELPTWVPGLSLRLDEVVRRIGGNS